ncbi:diguanylate cyclase domain-containing protein [Ancylobacter sp. TS-1]|uniref:diguanylate cyclase domain-containing protein n=1 Tax=Ancylobacter sp. TS-1 TaxID=1850374 RepID=UPI001265D058|nr:diguanylate cyclase [Ancylobacter sp. TS-1]QFR34399.1 diguanylate cyclase [Ancylobacter sp. TS-1]
MHSTSNENRLSGALNALDAVLKELFCVSHAELWLDSTTRRLCDLDPEGGADALADALPAPMDGSGDIRTVEDAAIDPEASELTRLGLRFAVRVPLGLPDDRRGALLLADTAPRHFELADRRRLAGLAAVASELVCLAIGHRHAGEREALYRLLAENSTDTIVRGNLDGERLYISPSVRTLLGYEPSELIGRRAIEIVHPDDIEEFRRSMEDLRAGRVDLLVSEQRQRRRDGSWVWLEALIKLTRDAQGRPDGYVASVRDISRRKAAEQRLSHIASHDLLTGLPNRSVMQARLAQELSRARRLGGNFALMVLDLDGFKQVNDTYGHEAGDAALRCAAERFRRTLRAEDLAARVGGDEFVVVQGSGGSTEGAALLADRLIRSMAEPIAIGERRIVVGLSVGVVLAPVEGLDADALLRAADQALYRAKQEGRNRRHLAEPSELTVAAAALSESGATA